MAEPKTANSDDMSVLADHISRAIMQSPPDGKRVAGLLTELTPDGRFRSVDYANKQRSGWQTASHLSNVLDLAKAWSADRDNARLRDAVHRSLGAWLKLDPKNSNWWWNEIGVPMSLGSIGIVLGPELTEQERDGLLRIMARAKIGMTGQNLVWLARINIVRGLIASDGDLIAKAVKAVTEEIRTSSAEGLQADFSFHQHGPQLYSGGYGRGFAIDCAALARLTAGTRWALPADKIELVSRYYLDGLAWMCWGATLDPSIRGREIVRPGGSAASLAPGCRDLAESSPNKAEPLNPMADRLTGNAGPNDTGPVGCRVFWRSDYVVFRQRGWFASVKMHSGRTVGYEIVNSEGLASYYLADGAMFIMRTGREYENIFPVWNWRRVPGVTCRQEVGQLPSGDAVGKTAFVGGVSDGSVGLAAFDYDRRSVRAKKSWFMLDRSVVALGAGISCDADEPVNTTVNQCLLNGPVMVIDQAGRRTLPLGQHKLEPDKWGLAVWHDGVVYVIAGRTCDVHISLGEQAGSWRLINSTAPDKRIVREVFALWLDHGRRPQNSAYAYASCPGVEADAFTAALVRDLLPDVLSNTDRMQSVRCGRTGQTLTAMFAAGESPPPAVKVEQACLLIASERDGKLNLTLSDPTQKLKSLQITLSAAAGRPGETISVALPSGQSAGASVSWPARQD